MSMREMVKDVTFLDCTLRDGGYYNQWDFSDQLVSDYLQCLDGIGVTVCEIGFRSKINVGYSGPYAFCKDEFLDTLSLPSNIRISVMVNAKELISSESIEKNLADLFPRKASDSRVDFVRIAFHSHELERALPAATWLKDRGYSVGFNFMQISMKSDADILYFSELCSSFPIDVLYFADSLGCMRPKDIERVFGLIQKKWSGQIGVHAHDNLGLALENSITALDIGATWVDSTVYGMGRGPGNTKTEELAITLSSKKQSDISISPLLSLIKNYFQKLQYDCGWGKNAYYFLAGIHSIHPTYIQKMLADSRFESHDIIQVIEYLKLVDSYKFNPEFLDLGRNISFSNAEAASKLSPWFSRKTVLLLGSGPGVKQHRRALEAYIEKEQPVVVCLNTNSDLSENFIKFRIACSPMRLIADWKEHHNLPQPLITPHMTICEQLEKFDNSKKIYNVGCSITPGAFTLDEKSFTIPNSLSLAYALAVITNAGAEEILLAGFDGYPGEDVRNDETNEIFKIYSETENSVRIQTVTSTRYKIPSKSIYGM